MKQMYVAVVVSESDLQLDRLEANNLPCFLSDTQNGAIKKAIRVQGLDSVIVLGEITHKVAESPSYVITRVYD